MAILATVLVAPAIAMGIGEFVDSGRPPNLADLARVNIARAAKVAVQAEDLQK